VGVVKVLVSKEKIFSWPVKICTFIMFGYLGYIMVVALVNTVCDGCVVRYYAKYIHEKNKREYVPPPIQEEEDDWDEDDDEDSSFH
jgi:hypothetical protein